MKGSNVIYVIVGVLTLSISASVVSILWWKGSFKANKRKGKGKTESSLGVIC